MEDITDKVENQSKSNEGHSDRRDKSEDERQHKMQQHLQGDNKCIKRDARTYNIKQGFIERNKTYKFFLKLTF